MGQFTRTAPPARDDSASAPAGKAPEGKEGKEGRVIVPTAFRPDVAPGLAAAFAHCREINRTYGKTYFFSTNFFPAALRPDVHALYAWVRYPDEWVDNPDGLSIDEQKARIEAWRTATRRAICDGENTASSADEHAVLLAWGDAARRHRVPLAYMDDFLDAMTMDLTVDRYQTFEDLKRYTWGSASVVVLMMCHLIGAAEPAAVPYATSLGLAMQMTNFLRDVGEDWRERGRIYLPMEDLERFGVTVDDIARQRVTENFRRLVRFEAERTRAIYAESDRGFDYIPASVRLPVRLARVLYARILDKIEQNGGDVLTRRARVPTWEKLAVLAREQCTSRTVGANSDHLLDAVPRRDE